MAAGGGARLLREAAVLGTFPSRGIRGCLGLRASSNEPVTDPPPMFGGEHVPQPCKAVGRVVEDVEDREPVCDPQPDELVAPFQRIGEPVGRLVIAGALEQAGELEDVLVRHRETGQLHHRTSENTEGPAGAQQSGQQRSPEGSSAFR